MATLPTLVLVPGAWHQPVCYSKIVERLESQHSVRCVSVTIPSATGDPSATFKMDVDAVRAAITAETAQGRDVVVLAHSYGGMVGNSAVRGLARRQGNWPGAAASTVRGPSDGAVVGLILIATGFTLNGFTMMDFFMGRPPPAWIINKETGFAELVVDPAQFFYHDVPAEEAAHWVSLLKQHSLKSLFEGGEHAYAGWRDVPSWYVGTIEDVGLPVAMQRVAVGTARGMGGNVTHVEMQTSHSPFLSQPAETVEVVKAALDAFAAEAAATKEAALQVAPRIPRVAAPAARLLAPSTWIKYGLPLGFGRVLGWTLWGLGSMTSSWKHLRAR